MHPGWAGSLPSAVVYVCAAALAAAVVPAAQVGATGTTRYVSLQGDDGVAVRDNACVMHDDIGSTHVTDWYYV